jgi:hypothetical protein
MFAPEFHPGERSMSDTFVLRTALVCAAALASAPEAPAQCKGGKQGTSQQGSSQTMTQAQQSGLTTRSMRRGFVNRGQSSQTQSQQSQSQQPGQGLTTQQTTDNGQPSLRTARQLQQQEVSLVATLEGMLDDQSLTQARQNRLQAAITSALQKILKQDDLLTSLEQQQQNGSLSAMQMRQLSNLIRHETALLATLDSYRTAVTQATTTQAARANQAR